MSNSNEEENGVLEMLEEGRVRALRTDEIVPIIIDSIEQNQVFQK